MLSQQKYPLTLNCKSTEFLTAIWPNQKSYEKLQKQSPDIFSSSSQNQSSSCSFLISSRQSNNCFEKMKNNQKSPQSQTKKSLFEVLKEVKQCTGRIKEQMQVSDNLVRQILSSMHSTEKTQIIPNLNSGTGAVKYQIKLYDLVMKATSRHNQHVDKSPSSKKKTQDIPLHRQISVDQKEPKLKMLDFQYKQETQMHFPLKEKQETIFEIDEDQSFVMTGQTQQFKDQRRQLGTCKKGIGAKRESQGILSQIKNMVDQPSIYRDILDKKSVRKLIPKGVHQKQKENYSQEAVMKESPRMNN